MSEDQDMKVIMGFKLISWFPNSVQVSKERSPSTELRFLRVQSRSDPTPSETRVRHAENHRRNSLEISSFKGLIISWIAEGSPTTVPRYFQDVTVVSFDRKGEAKRWRFR